MATESFFSNASLAYLASAGAGKDGKTYSMKPTDGTGDFTFSRGSNLAATRVGADGLIEKGRENLLIYSNDFSQSTWSKTRVDLTSGQTGYDGSSDAWLLEANADGIDTITQSNTLSGVMTASIYAKAGTTNWIRLSINDSGVNSRQWFDIANGQLGTQGGNLIDSKIISVGNGWYKCSITFSATATAVLIFLSDGDTSINVTTGDNIYIQDAQLEIGLAATDYIETGATTGKAGLLEDEPRFDYSGGATCPSLLLEPSRTNFIPNSEGADKTTSSSTSFTFNEIVSPDGYKNSIKVETLTAGTYRTISWVISLSAGAYTFSCFLKAGTSSYIGLYHIGTGLGWIDTSNFTKSSGSLDFDIENFGNGWYRIYYTLTATAGNNAFYIFNANTTGGTTSDVGDNFYGYGFQLEEGSYPTSYIPNHSGTGSVTRGEDESSVTGASSLIGQTEGTFYVDFEYLDGQSVANENWFALESDAGGDRILFYKGATTNQRILIQANASSVYSNSSLFALSAGTRYKLAVRYNSGDIAVYLNGSQLATDISTYTRTDNLNNVTFNESSQAPSSRFNQMLVFTEGLSNADLATLTTI